MGHEIYAVSPFERRKGGKERVIRENDHVSILKVMIGNTQKTNLIEKGISTNSKMSNVVNMKTNGVILNINSL